MLLVSACLLGINCKYNGDNNEKQRVKKYLKDKQYIVVCPEQLGGLSTPRNPAEILINNGEDKNLLVIDNSGNNVTDKFLKGAKETLKIAKICNCREAILKDGSPSCGSNYIYDGTFKDVKVSGRGVTSQMLYKNKIKVISEKEIPDL